MKRADFIKAIGEHARRDYTRSKVLPSITVAQAILESSWGQSGLTKRANNLFGVKTGKSRQGTGMMFPTKEYYNGQWVTVQAEFRKYTTLYESIVDHGTLLQLPRYTKVRGETDYKKAAHAIKAAGYATDPNYPALLIRIIEQFKLYEYDKPAQECLSPAELADITAILQEDFLASKDTKYTKMIDALKANKMGMQMSEQIIDRIQIRWGLAKNKIEKTRLHKLANAVRRVRQQ
jgi:hypothetical protein